MRMLSLAVFTESLPEKNYQFICVSADLPVSIEMGLYSMLSEFHDSLWECVMLGVACVN